MKKITVKEITQWLKSLEENKWRKTYNVDARRVAHFVNFGESIELPRSLRKKSKNANYDREISLSERYLTHIKKMEKNRKDVKMNEDRLRKFIQGKIKELL